MKAKRQQEILRIIEEQDVDTQDQLLAELRAWGRNLNQLTMLAHEGRVPVVYLQECTDMLGRTYEAVNGLLTSKGPVISHGDV